MQVEDIKIWGDDGICFKINRYLHRYHYFDENLEDSLRESYLWFSDPLSFNDPYDCNLDLNVYNSTYEEIYDYLKEENKKNSYKQGEDTLKARTEYLFNNIIEMEYLLKQANEETIKQKGICCFSENDDSLLMWSHYAKKHSGVCLTFDISKNVNLFKNFLYKVEYPFKYPVYNWPRDRKIFKSLRLLIATKSKEWEYENEVRIIRDFYNVKNEFRGKVKFDKIGLTSVKFGYKSFELEQNKIKSILENVGGYEHVKFYKAKLKKFEFGLEYEEIFI